MCINSSAVCMHASSCVKPHLVACKIASNVCSLCAKPKLSHFPHTRPLCWSADCCKVVKLCVICADDSAFSTPATAFISGHGNMLIESHGGGQMPTGLSPGYVMTTPDFSLPVLTPLPSTAHSQDSQDFVPDQDSAVAQPASSPRAACPATAGAAGASRITMAPRPTAEAPAVSSAASTEAAGSPAGPVAAPTACIAVASVEAAEVSTAVAPAQTPAGAIEASPAAAGLVPASAAAARTDGHGLVAVLPLFSGAQKRAASVIAQQVSTLKQWHECMFALAQLTWLHSCLCLFHSLL